MPNKKTSLFIKRFKSIANDSIWSIAALILLNVVSQFIIYPIWARKYGDEIYGNIIYAISIINIFSISIGIATNYARMAESSKRTTINGDYNRLIFPISFVAAALCFFILLIGDTNIHLVDAAFAGGLCFFTILRYYADVEYRLSLNYKGYFIYYALISAGYILGILLLYIFDIWALVLLPGEIVGLILVWKKGTIFKKDIFHISPYFKDNCHAILLLIATNFITQFIYNGDRILLQSLLGGVAVTTYYLASLVGKTMSLITTPFNSVIIGYLSRYKGKFTKKIIHVLFGITLVVILVGTIAGVLGSYIIISILYPNNIDSTKQYFLIANLSSVSYFVSNIVTTILLRIAEVKCQLKINIIYAITFFAFCIPAILGSGLLGFNYAVLATNILRYGLSIIYCYKSIRCENMVEENI